MKFNSKKSGILLIIWLIFPLILNSRFNSSNDYKTFIDNPQLSAGYTVSFIHIDGSIPGNWSATASLDWCSGTGTWIDPYIIEDVTIEASNSPITYGILIENSNAFFVIHNCKVYNSDEYGIYFNFVNNSLLINNNCSNNGYSGIALTYKCTNNTISGNIVNNNGDSGIYFYEEINNNTVIGNTANQNNEVGISLHWYSNNTIIKENTANENGLYGIELYDYCGYNTISDNSINNNGERGINIEYEGSHNKISKNIIENNGLFGMYLESYCIKNNFAENTLRNNSKGIYLDSGCDSNTISGNTICNNIEHGIYLEGGGEGDGNSFNLIVDNLIFQNNIGVFIELYSDYNSLYENSFIENLKHAIDNGADNKWNSSTIGNYWDNHTGPDNNNDGIVDNPYIYIGGSAGSIDYLPIAATPSEGLDPGIIALIIILSIIGGLTIIGVILRILLKRGKISFEKLKSLLSSFRKK